MNDTAINATASAFGALVRFSPGAVELSTVDGETRCVSAILNTEDVGLDNHVIRTAGLDTESYMVGGGLVPFCHKTDEPPVARMLELSKRGTVLTGRMQFADAETYPFADTVYRLLRGKYLNATSISWLPVEWERTVDRSRPGGIDFNKSRLLEASIVPLPANPAALITARSRGIDTRPLFDWLERALDSAGFAAIPREELEILRKAARMPAFARAEKSADWKVGAARDLPVSDKAAWDGPAAAKRMLDAASKDNSIGADAKRGFLIYDAANADLRGSYKEPFADLVDGKLTAIAGGIRAAASRLPDVGGASDEVKAEARKVLDGYEAKMKSSKDDRAAKAAATRALGKDLRQRGLGELSQLCDLLSYAEYVYDSICREADDEGDGSPIPDRLAAWLDEGNLIIAAMADEETQENLKGAAADEIERAVRRALADAGFTRSGKVLSEENERCLRSAHDHMETARCLVRSVIDKNGKEPDDENPEESDTDGDTDDARALRVRKAHALKTRQSAVGSRQ